MTSPYTTDPLHVHNGRLVRTTPDPTRDDKVMNLGRVVDSSGAGCPLMVEWLTLPHVVGMPVRSWVTPSEVLMLTHEVAQIALAELERMGDGRAALDAATFGVEYWLDKLDAGESCSATDLTRYVDSFHGHVTKLLFKTVLKEYRSALKKFDRGTYQRLQLERAACWKRIRATDAVIAHGAQGVPAWLR